jgi:hypothetical protein
VDKAVAAPGWKTAQVIARVTDFTGTILGCDLGAGLVLIVWGSIGVAAAGRRGLG